MQKLFTLVLFSLFCSVQFAQAQTNPARVWATYYFNNQTSISAIAADKDGNIYVTGATASGIRIKVINKLTLTPNIATPGSFKDTIGQASTDTPTNVNNLKRDAFLAKFTSAGVRLWCTYYGGLGQDGANAVMCDADGNVYIAGSTASTDNMSTSGSQQSTLGGGSDAFIAKFNGAGQRQWATYYGGAGTDGINALAVNQDGDLYVAGSTNSTSGISTTGAFKTSFSGGAASVSDGFIAKFNSAGTLQWGTYYGDTLNENLNSIVCDGVGNIYAAGTTASVVNIASAGAHQTTAGGGFTTSQQPYTDAFLVKFDGTGQRKWATYYGGGRIEDLVRVAYDKYGNNIYLAGTTSSSDQIATAGSFQEQNFTTGENEYDAFLAKFNADGQRQWGTYYGGAAGLLWGSYATGLSCDQRGNVCLSQTAQGTIGIATPGSYQDTFTGGQSDIFLVKFNAGGQRIWGTYYGGINPEYTRGHIYDNAGNLYVIGASSSTANIATENSFQDSVTKNKFTSTATPGILPFIIKFYDCIPVSSLNVTGNIGFCSGDSLTLKVDNGTAQTYQWQKNGADIASATDSAIAVKAPGSYRVIAGNGGPNCVDTSDVIVVTEHALPSPTVTANGNRLSTGHFVTYQWNKDGQPINGAIDSFYNGTGNGMYSVTVTDTNGCAATSAAIPTSVKNVTLAGSISIYPNPAVDVLYINATAPVSVLIYDVAGKLMLQQSNAKRLDVQSFAPGLYIVKITDAAGNLLQAERFVKAAK